MKEKNKEATFKKYYSALKSNKEKTAIRDKMVPVYVSYPSFYGKLKDETWTPLELEKLSEITNQNFIK